MKKILLMIITIIIIVLVSFLGCINNNKNESENNNKNESENNFSYLYEISINAEEHTEYEIFAPILVTPYVTEDDKNVSQIMNETIIIGNATTEIIQTIHGKALKINGMGNVIVIAKGNKNLPLARVTLLYDSDNDGLIADEHGDVKYWLYINTTSDISIEIEVSQQSFSYAHIKVDNIHGQGWIIVDGEFSEGAP